MGDAAAGSLREEQSGAARVSLPGAPNLPPAQARVWPAAKPPLPGRTARAFFVRLGLCRFASTRGRSPLNLGDDRYRAFSAMNLAPVRVEHATEVRLRAAPASCGRYACLRSAQQIAARLAA